MTPAPLPPPPPDDDTSVAGEEDPGAAIDEGIGGPVLPDVPVGTPPAQRPDEAPATPPAAG